MRQQVAACLFTPGTLTLADPARYRSRVAARQPSKRVILRLAQDLRLQEGMLLSAVANTWAKVLQVLSVSQVAKELALVARQV